MKTRDHHGRFVSAISRIVYTRVDPAHIILALRPASRERVANSGSSRRGNHPAPGESGQMTQGRPQIRVLLLPANASGSDSTFVVLRKGAKVELPTAVCPGRS